MSDPDPTAIRSSRSTRRPSSTRDAARPNLFDLRRMIGGLFLIYGVILVILGLGAVRRGDRQGGGLEPQPVGRRWRCWSSPRSSSSGRSRGRSARASSWATSEPGRTRRPASQRRRAGGPGATAAAPAGSAAPGGSSASTEPPKPPPTMRAPAAPARLSARHRGLDRGHARLVVVAQARVRGVEQPRRPPAGRRRAARRPSRRRGRSRSARGARGGRSGAGSAAAASGSAALRCSTPSASHAARHSARRSL